MFHGWLKAVAEAFPTGHSDRPSPTQALPWSSSARSAAAFSSHFRSLPGSPLYPGNDSHKTHGTSLSLSPPSSVQFQLKIQKPERTRGRFLSLDKAKWKHWWFWTQRSSLSDPHSPTTNGPSGGTRALQKVIYHLDVLVLRPFLLQFFWNKNLSSLSLH